MFNFKNNKDNNYENNNTFDDFIDDDDSSLEEDYIQIEFNTDPEPEVEETDETVIKEDVNNSYSDENDYPTDKEVEEYFEHRYILEADLKKALKEVSENKDKTIKRSVLISTIISSLVTASAFGGYHIFLRIIQIRIQKLLLMAKVKALMCIRLLRQKVHLL